MGEEDRVLGGFEAETPLNIGSERFYLLFTRTQVILAHAAKLGKESMAFSNILGALAKGIGASPRKPEMLGKLAALSPEAILELDKDNFGVGYDQVVSITVRRAGREKVDLALVTRDRKVAVSASLVAVQGLREIIMEKLPGKAVFEF